MDALCPSTLLDLTASAGGEGTVEVLAEWAAAEGVDLSSPEQPAGPSEASGTLLVGSSEAKAQAGDGTGATGTRQEFVATFHRQQLWKDIMVECLTFIGGFVLLYRVSRDAALL